MELRIFLPTSLYVSGISFALKKMKKKKMMTEKTETENHTPRILMIDDDEEFTEDLKFLLDGPYQIVAVNESNKGIELLEKEKFDLVILDLVMPAFYADQDEKEGTEVLTMIKNKWRNTIPTIILTQMNKLNVIDTCHTLGADAFFIKPPVIEELKEKINKLIKY